MGAYTFIVIILIALAAIVSALGYALGALHGQRDQTRALQRQIEVNRRRIAAQGAVIHAIAQNYDPATEETPEQRRAHFRAY